MSLEFGLILTGLGVLAMFLALMVIIITCEVLKRMFREKEVEIVQVEESAGQVPLERKGIGARA